MHVVPRCLAGISPEALQKLIKLLENEPDSELKEAVERLIDMANKEIDEQNKEK